MKYILLFLILLVSGNSFLVAQNHPQHNKIVVGYYAQWAIYARDYNVLDIEADKLTHLMYAFYNATYDASTQTAAIKSLALYADYDNNESGLHPWYDSVKGNIGDLKLLKEDKRMYHLLEHVVTKPNVFYHTKIIKRINIKA